MTDVQIVVDNRIMDYNTGIKILKLKYRDNSPFPETQDLWDEVPLMDFKDISALENIEDRRIALQYCPLSELLKTVKHTLISKKTLKKTTTWKNIDGETETLEYEDTYELYSVSSKDLGVNSWRDAPDRYFVRFWCTSTHREYIVWVNAASIYNIKRGYDPDAWVNLVSLDVAQHIDAIDAVAWTMTTVIPQGQIEKIYRQGDCIFIKPTEEYSPAINPHTRHLTKEEYLTLMENES